MTAGRLQSLPASSGAGH